jgi:hypothetical protein
MKGIYVVWDDDIILGKTKLSIIKQIKNAGYTDVFMYGEDSLKDWVSAAHKNQLKVHLNIDCFSGVKYKDVDEWYKRYDILIKKVKDALVLGVDGINLDAIRLHNPTLTNINEKCLIIAGVVCDVKHLINEHNSANKASVLLSCCVKSEWSLNYATLNFAARLYGQDYSMLGEFCDFLMCMSYRNIYSYGVWRLLNPDYDEDCISAHIQYGCDCKTIPILWAYNSINEYSFRRAPTEDELNSMHCNCGEYADHLYRDMIKAKLI